MTATNLTEEHTTNPAGPDRPAAVGSKARRAGLPERMAVRSARRPGRTLGLWLLAVLVSLVLASAMHGLTSDAHVVGSTESSRAEALYDTVEGGSPAHIPTDAIVIRSDRTTVADPSFDAAVTGLESRVRGLPGITAVRTDLRQGSTLVSSDGRAAIIELRAATDADIAPVVRVVQSADGVGGLSVAISGQHTVNHDVSTLASDDLRKGELDFGLPIALVVLLLVFGAVVAGLLPLLMAILSIAVGMGLASLVSQEFQLSTFIVNMMTAMGLALGIDYSLFIVSRFREERRRGYDKDEAIRRTGATAGRAVLFSGSTFTVALLALFVVPTNVMRSLAAGAIIVGIVSVAAALTLLPALLALLDHRVDALRLPFVSAGQGAVTEGRAGRWRALVGGVVRRPAISLAVAAGALVIMAVPVLGLHIGQSGVSTLPDSVPSKAGFVALERAFPDQNPSPVEIVALGTSRATRSDLGRLGSVLAGDPMFGPGSVRSSSNGDVHALTVPIQGDPVSSRDVAAVRHLRSVLIPETFAGSGATVLVGGQTAEIADYFHAVAAPTPWVLVFVLGISFILLLLAFRSVVVAAISIVLNLLGVGAAYGLLTLVFIHGIGTRLLGFVHVTAIDAWVPLFLFSVLFALSMDYQVFLMSRIKERYDLTGSTHEAVVDGVASTARIITGAALIIIVVFAGFARGQLAMFQQMGFGVAVALFLDATLVRLVILPSILMLFGDRSWHLPAWLGWLPHLEIEAPADRPTAGLRASSPSTPATGRKRGTRGLRWPLALGGLAMAVIVSVVATTQPTGAAMPHSPARPRPAFSANFADPSVVVADGRYYAYATQSDDENIQMISSRNLWAWGRPKDVLPKLPVWAVAGFTWAPAVAPNPGGGYELYFAARDRALGIECIGRALARTPVGPFSDPSRWPFLCQASLGGSIDPYVFRDRGRDYLIWKSDGENGTPQRIWAQALDRRDVGVVGSAIPLLSATTGWENGVVEGPAMVRLGGVLHLYFSANRWSSSSYSIGAVACRSPLGPCGASQPHEALTTADGMIGPGGPSFFVTPSGQLMVALAAWTGNPKCPESHRSLFVTAVSASGSAPTLVDSIRVSD